MNQILSRIPIDNINTIDVLQVDQNNLLKGDLITAYRQDESVEWTPEQSPFIYDGSSLQSATILFLVTRRGTVTA